jgi:hypothetical protein
MIHPITPELRDQHRVEQPRMLRLDVYHVDAPSRTLMRAGRPVDLTPKDFDLSVLFLRNVGQLLSRTCGACGVPVVTSNSTHSLHSWPSEARTHI